MVEGPPNAKGAGSPAAEALEGRVVRTVYHDARTRYTVLRVHVEGRADLVTVVGRTHDVEEGAEVVAQGEWTVHPSHGEQFAFERLRVATPTTPKAIERRLKRYPGIKDVMAQRIVAKFGEDTLSILDKQPRRLLEVEGVGPKTFERILAYHETRVGPQAELEDRLIELEVSPRFADAILRRFGDEALSVLERHPYRLAREVRGIGFMTADRVARALGVDLDSDERVDAGLLHVLESAESDGHCGLPRPTMLEQARQLLGVQAGRVEEGIERLIEEATLVVERDDTRDLLFPRDFVFAEHHVADALCAIAGADFRPWPMVELPEHLSEGQVDAVQAIAQNGVVVLTGGPGTGKSTVVRQVIELADAQGEKLYLAAPTGRAAKRLEQATGRPASTVHRLLEVQGESGEFAYNANNPLEPGLLVVDEASMLDIELAEALFSALTEDHRLLIVGDADQLPSVGPGNVLRDVIRASQQPDSPIPVVRLTQIFRQAEGSSIVLNAHRILSGQALAPDPSGEGGEFFFIRAPDGERAHELIVKMATERIPEAFGLDPRLDVQVLCPMHKGRAGTEALNRALQHAFTAEAAKLELPAYGRLPPRAFHVGDRVMQIRNDYERGVFNGDIGQVTAVDAETTTLVAEIDGRPVAYETKDLGALRLAYAVSIHKSQGSEFPAVLVPLLGEHHVMLRRNLLYTAVTRAKKLCVVVGDPRAVQRAIARSDAAHRFTFLAERLQGAFSDRLGLGIVEREDGIAQR